MVIYEVNLQIEAEIFAAFSAWLMEHVQKMLQFKGFLKADIYREENVEHCITIWYHIDTREHLQDYLDHHATAMRADALNKFSSRFKATRRIFNSM